MLENWMGYRSKLFKRLMKREEEKLHYSFCKKKSKKKESKKEKKKKLEKNQKDK